MHNLSMQGQCRSKSACAHTCDVADGSVRVRRVLRGLPRRKRVWQRRAQRDERNGGHSVRHAKCAAKERRHLAHKVGDHAYGDDGGAEARRAGAVLRRRHQRKEHLHVQAWDV